MIRIINLMIELLSDDESALEKMNFV